MNYVLYSLLITIQYAVKYCDLYTDTNKIVKYKFFDYN